MARLVAVNVKLRILFANHCKMTEKAPRFRVNAALLIMVLAFILTGIPHISMAEGAGFRVFMVEIDPDVQNDSNVEPLKDIYISGGKAAGLDVSNILDVYRPVTVYSDHVEKDLDISILVGKIKIIRVYKDVAIARIVSLTASDGNPIISYRTVMIGDKVFPENQHKVRNKEADRGEGEQNTVKKDSSLGAKLSIPSKVLFEFDDWRLKPEAQVALSIVHDIFSQSNDKDILVEGHTGNLGSDKYNIILSEKRAKSVAEYLMLSMGIPKERIQIKYYGEKFPIASNDIEEGRKRNRRVNIQFLESHKSLSKVLSTSEQETDALRVSMAEAK